MLTKAAKYAVRSTIYLAMHSHEKKCIKVKEIAQDLNVPPPFLAKLMQQLSRANLVSSLKGPKGGFFMSHQDKQNNLWEVIKCIDGEKNFHLCFIGNAVCDESNPCVFHEIAADFKANVMEKLANKTLESIIEEPNLRLL